MTITRTPAERFWPKVDVQPSGCWLWTGHVMANGYGQFRAEALVLAHRWAWEDRHGPIPTGLQLDHQPTCPKHCVNPGHLRLATNKQNAENRAGAQANSSSGIRGVYWHKRFNCWLAKVQHNGRQINVGYFQSTQEAEAAVIAARLELFTHNALDRSHG